MVSEIDSCKLEYRYQAITDTQGTIRAIDTKIGVLFLVLLVPFSILGDIRGHILSLFTPMAIDVLHIFSIVLTFIFISSYILSLIISLKAIIAIDNPANHINSSIKHNGSFYLPGLFRLQLIDSIVNRKEVLCSCTLSEILDKSPEGISEIQESLTFEHIKLAYIREVKLHRQRWAFIFALFFLISGFILYLCSICK